MPHKYVIPVIIGIAAGLVARLFMLRTDYRQYPTYPHGRIIHLALGFIASFIGSVAIPAVLEGEWTAVTFLGLAAQQFRDVREMERKTLKELDSMELVPRGASYIEGTAQAFEGRNYLVMFTSIVTTATVIWLNVWWSIATIIIMILFDKAKMSGKQLKSIARIEEGKITFDGPFVYVDNIPIMNVGLPAKRETILEQAVGMIVIPKNANSIVTLSNLGQRQAMLHNVSIVLGAYRDSGEPSLVPMAKRDMNDGRIGLLLLPQVKERDQIKKVLQQVPVLDSAIRLPSEANRGRQNSAS